MIISHKHRFIYIAPPKTGTSTIAEALKCFGGKPFSVMPSYGKQLVHCKHVPAVYANYFIFGSVRNPYSRLISLYWHWRYDQNRHESFEEMLPFLLRDSHSQALHLAQYRKKYKPYPGCVYYDLNALLHLENLEEEFAQLPFVDRRLKLPRFNAMGAAKLAQRGVEYYDIKFTQPQITLIKERWHRDFVIGGYEKRCPERYRLNPLPAQ